MKRLAILILITLIPVLAYADDYLPSRVYIDSLNIKQTPQQFFENTFRAYFASQTNIALAEKHNTTNYTDVADTHRFVVNNKLQGLVKLDFTEFTGNSYEVRIFAYTPGGIVIDFNETFTMATVEEAAKQASLKVSEKFPMRSREVIVREEVRHIDIGVFEYVHPTFYFGIGPSLFKHSSMVEFGVEDGEYFDEDINNTFFALNLFVNFRYRWFGAYLSIDCIFPSFAFIYPQIGLELNLFKGLINLRGRLGNVSYNRRNELEGNDLRYYFSYLTLGGDIYINITRFFSVSIGATFRVPSEDGTKSVLYDNETAYYADPFFESQEAGFDAFSIGYMFKLSRHWQIENKWYVQLPNDAKFNQPSYAREARGLISWISIAVIFKFDLGELK
jgi:hypothetical protein